MGSIPCPPQKLTESIQKPQKAPFSTQYNLQNSSVSPHCKIKQKVTDHSPIVASLALRNLKVRVKYANFIKLF